jgi:hypothetical protein
MSQLASCVWQLASCGSWEALWPLASCVAVGKLHTVDKPYIAGELGGHWLAMWSLASCVAGGKLFGSVMFGGLGVRPGVGADVPVTHRRQALWQLASSVAAGKLCGDLHTTSELCDSWEAMYRWQAMAVGDLHTISELCDSWEAMYRWQALWQLVSCCSWRSVNH